MTEVTVQRADEVLVGPGHELVGELDDIIANEFLQSPALVFLNALTPYVGLKTQNSWTMYSNLQTEPGRWNHSLIPEVVRLPDAAHPDLLARVTFTPGHAGTELGCVGLGVNDAAVRFQVLNQDIGACRNMVFKDGRTVGGADTLDLDLRPRRIMTKEAFENAIAVGMALGGSALARSRRKPDPVKLVTPGQSGQRGSILAASLPSEGFDS